MWRLFVNADDFGLTEGVSQGIAAAMAAGVVGGTTAMVCAPGAVECLRRFGASLSGRVGLHLQLTGGIPCLPAAEIPSLVGPDGRFPRKKKDVGPVVLGEVRREWRAQLARLRACGLEPSHIDSHHHVHRRPELFPIFLEIARELRVPARALSDPMRAALDASGIPHADGCLTDWFGHETTADRFLSLVGESAARLPEGGSLEVMTHPGHCDATLVERSTYAEGREIELTVLGEPSLKAALAARGFVPVGPDGLAGMSNH